MFVPAPYREPAPGWTARLVQAHPLALLASGGDGETPPHATHLPIVSDRPLPAVAESELGGHVLHGHLNKANPHWRALRAGTPAVLVFTGPHGYVSPDLYDRDVAAPTWDYTAAHLRGTVYPIESAARTLEIVEATARIFENRFGQEWDCTGSLDYFRGIVGAVGAFDFVIDHAAGMFKLSQEQKPGDRDAVRDHFRNRGRLSTQAAASMMDELPERGAQA